ncbi:MAG: hypothetical protein COW30_10975 [Rhodospirillales bacterium CG15_BIG_FIL_POST_REV_8_21_14_020_66_15]|nr:MAG: hypothetical protein COW30_10975 [Rhodospirillales bacterium CG15_BIG_FIL_POST_REV_8_21_14_020_66_15]
MLRHLTNLRIWGPPTVFSGVLLIFAQIDYLAFHTTAELVSIVIGYLLFALAWETRDLSDNPFLTFLAAGYFWISTIDLLHALTYEGMDVLPITGAPIATQLWLAARFLEAVALLAAPMASNFKLHRTHVFLAFSVIALACVTGIFLDMFPTAYVRGTGLTDFKIYSEYAIVLVMLLALWSVRRAGDAIAGSEIPLITTSIILTIVAELAFTFYVGVYDLSNLIGHLLKVYSFWLIYRAVVVTNLRKPYRSTQRLASMRHAIMECQSAILRNSTEQSIMQSCIDTLAGHRNYELVWIGMPFMQPEGPYLSAVAVAGKSHLNTLAGELAGLPRFGPVWDALQSGQVKTFNIRARSGSSQQWAEAVAQHGLGCAVSVPLIQDREPIAVLTVHANVANLLEPTEIGLLSELAANLSLALGALRTKEESRVAKDALGEAALSAIYAVAKTVEKRDPYTSGHQQRVAQLAVAIGRELDWDPFRTEGLRLAAVVHDIGKIYVPAEILNRPGRLSDAEFDMIKSHPQVGFDIMADVKSPWPIAKVILQHHERLDGSGYPFGLKGDEIIEEARVLAIADVVEAITAHRPYRPARGEDAAIEEIRRGSGMLYDPDVVDACISLFEGKRFAW